MRATSPSSDGLRRNLRLLHRRTLGERAAGPPTLASGRPSPPCSRWRCHWPDTAGQSTRRDGSVARRPRRSHGVCQPRDRWIARSAPARADATRRIAGWPLSTPGRRRRDRYGHHIADGRAHRRVAARSRRARAPRAAADGARWTHATLERLGRRGGRRPRSAGRDGGSSRGRSGRGPRRATPRWREVVAAVPPSPPRRRSRAPPRPPTPSSGSAMPAASPSRTWSPSAPAASMPSRTPSPARSTTRTSGASSTMPGRRGARLIPYGGGTSVVGGVTSAAVRRTR